MKQVVLAFLTLVFTLTAAQAGEWESANGETYDVYMVQPVHNEDDNFAIFAFFLDTEGKSLNDVVNLADQIFEEAVIKFATDANMNAAVVRISPPGDYSGDELPPVTIDVRYDTYDGEHWERVNYTDEVPVGPSPLFPYQPRATVQLSSGEDLEIEPATILFANDPDRRELNVRAIYPFFVIENGNGERVMALLWDEVVRDVARQENVNNVSVAIYSEPADGRFDFRSAYAEVFAKNAGESWPTYARMSNATPDESN
jgi:hypothetical protein